MGARTRLTGSIAALAAAAAVAGCGGEDFPREPRPPATISLSALITDTGIKVSPRRVGAGPARFTIANQSSEPGALILEGPTDAASREVLPGNTGALAADLLEGEYVVASGEDLTVRESTLEVGPERRSASNELQLP